MDTEQRSSGVASDDARGPEETLPYEKPRILLREPLEAVAAACTPSPPGKSAGICALTFS